MIKLRSKGNFSKSMSYLEKLRFKLKIGSVLEKYGRRGVEALSAATPRDTGLTANSWYYEVTSDTEKGSLTFFNSNRNKGVPIALIIQYGHGTGTGGWVEGRDYINPVIEPIFEQIEKEVWEEVTKV